MSRHRDAFIVDMPNIQFNGYTDLSLGDKKFSGNAQRRKKNTILFHGTFLYNFDINKIADVLQHPSKEPTYRQQRSHHDFITNISLSSLRIQQLLKGCWRIENSFYFNTTDQLT